MSPARAEATARKLVAEPAGRAPRARPTPVREADVPRHGMRRVTHAIGALREGSQLGRIGTLTVVALFASVFGIVIFQTLIVQGQARLDSLTTRTAAEEARSKDLRHQVVDLESPERIVAAARDRLAMISPADVVYLQPAEADDGAATYVAPPPTAAPVPTKPKASTTKKATTPSTSSSSPTAPAASTTVKKTTTTTAKSSPTATAPTKAKKP